MYLRTKFQVSSIILTGFRQGVILPKNRTLKNLFSFNLLQDYLSNHKSRTKVDSFYSFWEDISSGVPLGPITGLVLFNIFMCDMFLILKAVYFTGYDDNNTHFAVIDNNKDLIQSLEMVGKNLITWFSNNKLKVNPDKCDLYAKEKTTLKLSSLQICNF